MFLLSASGPLKKKDLFKPDSGKTQKGDLFEYNRIASFKLLISQLWTEEFQSPCLKDLVFQDDSPFGIWIGKSNPWSDLTQLVSATVYYSGLSHFSMARSPPGSSARGILQVAMPTPTASSWPGDWTHVSDSSCFGRQVFYHWCHLENPFLLLLLFYLFFNNTLMISFKIIYFFSAGLGLCCAGFFL